MMRPNLYAEKSGGFWFHAWVADKQKRFTVPGPGKQEAIKQQREILGEIEAKRTQARERPPHREESEALSGKRLEDYPDVLNVEELAKLLRLNTRTCYRKIQAGELPARRVGRRVLISKLAIARWLENLE